MDNNANQSAPTPPAISEQPASMPSTPTTPPKRPYHLTLLNKISIITIVVILVGLGLYFFLSRSEQPEQPPLLQPTQPVTGVPSSTMAFPTLSVQVSNPTALPLPITTSNTPADPTGLNVVCNNASSSATLTWNAVPNVDLYFVHIRGGTTEDTRVYGTSHTVSVESGKTYNWWMEAVKHSPDFKEAYASKSIGGLNIRCN